LCFELSPNNLFVFALRKRTNCSGMKGFDRESNCLVQDEVATLAKLAKNTSANKLVSKVKAFFEMPAFALAAV